MSYGEKTVFPHALPFILGLFPPRTCTWRAVIGWIPTEATSSGHFAYLSAGRSWLATFIWERTTEKVSISPFFTHLARCPRPVMGIPPCHEHAPPCLGSLSRVPPCLDGGALACLAPC